MSPTSLVHKIALGMIPGVGDITARKIVSYAGSVEAVFSESFRNLTKIPGVGKKMADRIILELRDRVIKLAPEEARDEVKAESALDAIREDALSALVNLGYKKSLAKTVVDRVVDSTGDGLALEVILKRALKELS